MASRPQFPQPASIFTRARLAVQAFRDGPPIVRPVPEAAEAAPALPAAPPDANQYSRHPSGFSIDPRWLGQLALNSDTILAQEGAYDLELFNAILDDDICASAFQQRRQAVVSRPWEVEAGAEDARAKAAADFMRENVNRLPWDNICDKQLFYRWFGYGVGECLFAEREGKIWLTDVLVPDRNWFGFTNAGELRLKTAEAPEGERVPPNKFWTIRAGGSHDFLPYGVGLAHWCYWPVWFKRNVVKFWAVYLEKFGMPTALGKFEPGADQGTRDNLLAAAAAVGRDAAVIIPNSTELELLASGRTGDGSYPDFVGEMKDSLLRIILSQTGTSKAEAQGLGGSQSEVHKEVRDEVVKGDSDLLHESFNGGPVAWLTAWNFGPDVAPPRVYRRLEEEEDLDTQAARDAVLYPLGIRRTPESIREIYGEGYEMRDLEAEAAEREREAAETAAEAGGQAPGGPGGEVVDLDEARKAKLARQFAVGDKAPLYVRRDLKPASARALLAWAGEAGIPNLYEPAALHVTVLYSKSPVDWFDMGEAWGDDGGGLTVRAGGPRAVEKLGDKGAVVLRFSSWALKARHQEMIERGASHDFPEYASHVTLALAPDWEAPDGREPFLGPL